ncbi:MAG: hypothetical protein ACYCX4_05665 [Bacillota bacterium]
MYNLELGIIFVNICFRHHPDFVLPWAIKAPFILASQLAMAQIVIILDKLIPQVVGLRDFVATRRLVVLIKAIQGLQ